jgi:N6-adenosine-specific RNA methylase IME4
MTGRVTANRAAKYRTIVADPPWTLKPGGPQTGYAPGARTFMPYPMMDVDEIASLPVHDWAARDAHLYLWTINAYVRDAYWIAEAWGFRPSTLLTWVKPPNGLGLGGAYSLTTEHVLFCRRGSLKALTRVDRTAFEWARGVHSAKPEAFLDLVESVSPAPRLEVFARRNRLGWSTWGNEALEHVGASA